VGVLFQRAVQATDGKKLHLAVAAMYERTSQPEAAEALLKAACRKHAGSAKVWLRHVQHLLGAGKGAAAKAVMDRSLQSLPKRKHIKVISQVRNEARPPTSSLSAQRFREG
jgi:rRNA biogenesis protein RRP5